MAHRLVHGAIRGMVITSSRASAWKPSEVLSTVDWARSIRDDSVVHHGPELAVPISTHVLSRQPLHYPPDGYSAHMGGNGGHGVGLSVQGPPVQGLARQPLEVAFGLAQESVDEVGVVTDFSVHGASHRWIPEPL